MLNFDLSQLTNPGAVPSLNDCQLKDIKLCTPPIIEQQHISDFLDQETAKIDDLVSKIESMLEKMREYRSALITAAVTGKIDVKGNS